MPVKIQPFALIHSSLLVLLLLLSSAVGAQTPSGTAPAPGSDAAIDAVEASLGQLQAQLQTQQASSSDTVETLRNLAAKVVEQQRNAQAQATALQPQLQQVDERLGQLGEVAPGSKETPDVAAERKQLQASHDQIDSAIKRARLLSVKADQLTAAVEQARTQKLGEQLSQRVDSPLSPRLWRAMSKTLPGDLASVADLGRQARAGFIAGMGEYGVAGPLLSVLLPLLLLFPSIWLLRRAGQRYAVDHGPGSRLRRSGLAVWTLLVGTVLPTLAVWVLVQSLRGFNAIPDSLDALANGLISCTGIAAFIGAVTSALMLPRQPSWRLLSLDDASAIKLTQYGYLTALLFWICSVLLLINREAHNEAVTKAALEGALALIFVALIVATMVSMLRIHRAVVADGAGDGDEAPVAAAPKRSGIVVLVSLIAQLAVAAALIGALLGYVHFALTTALQVVWTTVLFGAGGLLMMFAEDLSRWIFAPDSRLGKAAGLALGLRASHLEQAGVLLSAILRLWVLVLLLGALLAPYGADVSGMFDSFTKGWQGFDIAGVKLEPGRILQAIVVVVVGLGILKAFQNWLKKTYLPSTEMDPSTRASVAAVARYLGIAVVVLWTLTTLGFDLKNLAILASALSVGIGFGLQAITQNFISGLILMAERPVKIGDWVRIGDAEGDIRRINVRSTEIQVGDKSTLIVPNSELITKTIRNMTMASPLGRVQLQFSVPLGTDVAQVQTLLLGIYDEHAEVLAEPAPSVYIDSISGGMVAINSFAYVQSPRAVYAARSDLFFRLLGLLGEADIALSTPQDVRIIGTAAEPARGLPEADPTQRGDPV